MYGRIIVLNAFSCSGKKSRCTSGPDISIPAARTAGLHGSGAGDDAASNGTTGPTPRAASAGIRGRRVRHTQRTARPVNRTL